LEGRRQKADGRRKIADGRCRRKMADLKMEKRTLFFRESLCF
jgi:hypothetical protein